MLDMCITEVRLPPLTDSLQRLLSLSAADKTNLSLLELLSVRDPVAVSRLLVLANSAAFSRGAHIRTVSEAVFRLGAQATYDALLAIWVVESFSDAKEPGSSRRKKAVIDPVRTRLAQHLTSLCITSRRIYESLGALPFELAEVQSDAVMTFSVQLLPLCAPDDSPERESLEQLLQGKTLPRFLLEPPFPEFVKRYLVPLADYWGADKARLQVLQQWAQHHEATPGLCVALLAEHLITYLSAQPVDQVPTPDAFRDPALPEACLQLLEQVAANGILASSLVVRV